MKYVRLHTLSLGFLVLLASSTPVIAGSLATHFCGIQLLAKDTDSDTLAEIYERLLVHILKTCDTTAGEEILNKMIGSKDPFYLESTAIEHVEAKKALAIIKTKSTSSETEKKIQETFDRVKSSFKASGIAITEAKARIDLFETNIWPSTLPHSFQGKSVDPVAIWHSTDGKHIIPFGSHEGIYRTFFELDFKKGLTPMFSKAFDESERNVFCTIFDPKTSLIIGVTGVNGFQVAISDGKAFTANYFKGNGNIVLNHYKQFEDYKIQNMHIVGPVAANDGVALYNVKLILQYKNEYSNTKRVSGLYDVDIKTGKGQLVHVFPDETMEVRPSPDLKKVFAWVKSKNGSYFTLIQRPSVNKIFENPLDYDYRDEFRNMLLSNDLELYSGGLIARDISNPKNVVVGSVADDFKIDRSIHIDRTAWNADRTKIAMASDQRFAHERLATIMIFNDKTKSLLKTKTIQLEPSTWVNDIFFVEEDTIAIITSDKQFLLYDTSDWTAKP